MNQSISVIDAFKASTEYFSGDELAANVFSGKYALPDGAGGVLEHTPDDMHKRLAREFARVESGYPNAMSEDEIYHLFRNWSIVAQGSPLSGIGNLQQVQSLSNCFVVAPPEDSYGGILFTDQEQVQIMKRRGGVGFDVSKIRPKGQATANAARTTDGLAIFMERFSNSCREVAQGGRRGALMITIDCRHPEIETFIDIKRDRKKVTGANISIRFNDEFMQCVEDNDPYVLRWPVEADVSDAVVVKEVGARDIWEKFVDAAWESAEPGALFWDRVIEGPADCYGGVGYRTVSTNPCAEIPLSSYDSCRLMVINLTKFVIAPFTQGATFDFDTFHDVVIKAQRLMDDLIDLEIEAIDKIIAKINGDPEAEETKRIEIELWNKVKVATLGGRRTGLGPTGVGDALAALGLKYGSDESIKMTEKIYRAHAVGAFTSSIIMAKERGAFPVYDIDLEKDNTYLKRIWGALPKHINELRLLHGRRNIALTTTAPVGSVSCLTQTTSGIEPVYMIGYNRRKKIVEHGADTRVDFIDELGDRWQEFTVYHHGVKKWMEVTGKTEIDDTCPYNGATSPEIDWIQSVKIQAAAQLWVCHGISKTCNLPEDVDKSVVSDVYMKAWKSGCKGFTVYREGSRDGVLIPIENVSKETDRSKMKFAIHAAPKRPEIMPCEIHHATIKGEKWTILVGLFDNRPYEVLGGLAEFVEIPSKYSTGCIKKRHRKTRNSIYDLLFGENGNEITIKDVVRVFDNPNYAVLTRMISLSLRHGAPINYVVEQLQKDRDADLFSFAKVISRVLKKFIKDGTKPGGGVCPSCSEDALTYQEGCITCVACGHGKCG